jgi:hypothetical protein
MMMMVIDDDDVVESYGPACPSVPNAPSAIVTVGHNFPVDLEGKVKTATTATNPERVGPAACAGADSDRQKGILLRGEWGPNGTKTCLRIVRRSSHEPEAGDGG